MKYSPYKDCLPNKFIGRFYLLITITILISFPSTLLAQRVDSLNRELTVVSEHQAIIGQQIPQKANYHFENQKNITTVISIPTPSRDFLPPVVIPTHPLLSSRATKFKIPSKIGFLSLLGGVGPNLQVDAGLNISLNNSSRLLFDLFHSTSSNWSSYGRDLKSKRLHIDSEASIGYQYQTYETLFDIAFFFEHNRFNFFGLYPSNLTSQEGPSKKLTTPLYADEYFTAIASHLQKENESNKIDLNLKVDYTNLNPFIKKTIKKELQNAGKWSFQLNGSYISSINSLFCWGVKSQTKLMYNRSVALGIKEAYDQALQSKGKNFFFICQQVTPLIGIEGYIGTYPWHIYIGASANYMTIPYDETNEFDNKRNRKKIHYHPYFDATITFNKYMSLFGKVDGGTHFPNRFGDNLYNRFIAPGFPLMPERKNIDAKLGINVNTGGGFSFSLSSGYIYYTSKNFLIPRKIYLPQTMIWELPNYITFKPYQIDTKLFYGRVDFSYILYKKLELSMGAIYHYYKPLNNELPQGIIPLETNLSLTYYPLEKLSFFADLFLGIGVKQLSPIDSLKTEKALTFGRILMGGNYRINSYFALHLSLGNPSFITRTFPYAYKDYYTPFAFQVGASILF